MALVLRVDKDFIVQVTADCKKESVKVVVNNMDFLIYRFSSFFQQADYLLVRLKKNASA